MDKVGTIAELLALDGRQDLWHLDECPPGCPYRTEREVHRHERHDDGSYAVVGYDASGLFELLEFQGTLGF